MAYLDYYRSNPSWATQQSQSLVPPAPSFQPQPSWGGPDFYRAVAGPNYDGGLYNYASNRLQGIGPQGLASMGVSISEAKMFHRMAYGGLGDILTMTPSEIGAAAAYEVWRNWRYNYGTLAQPLGGDMMRQREALVGLAVGEATKLWQYTTRVGDNTGRLAAVEAAAITAARIFDQGNSSLMGSGGAYGGGMGAGMAGAAGGIGALSPVIPGGAMGGDAMGGATMGNGTMGPIGTAGMGMGMGGGMGGMGGGMGGMGAGMGGMGAGMGGMGAGMRGMGAGMRGMGAGMGAGMAGGMGGGMGGMGGVAGGAMSPMPVAAQSLAAPALVRRRSLSVGPGAMPGGYGYSAGTAGVGNLPSYAGSDMGGYATSNGGMLAPGGSAGIQRPLSSSGIRYGPPSDYGPGGFAETAIARHERHKAERAAARAERAALKGARYRGGPVEGNFGPGRAYDDNYPYEQGRGGYGNYGGRYEDDYGSEYGGDDNRSYGPVGGAGRRASNYGDGYGYGRGRYSYI